MTRTASYPALTQELHYEAAVEVARRVCEGEADREALLAAGAPLTEASTSDGRRRAAATVMTRLGLGRRRHLAPTGLLQLLAQLPEDAGRRLWVYVAATREPMLAAVARDVLYPYFVQCATPRGFGSEEFSAINANGLFEVAGAITHAAVAAYAHRHWGLVDPALTGRVLRVLRKGGILEATWISRSSARCLGYFPVGGLPDLACLAYAIHSTPGHAGYLRIDRLRAGLFVHLFLLRPIAVDYLLGQAVGAGLVGEPEAGIAPLRHESLEQAAETIIRVGGAPRPSAA